MEESAERLQERNTDYEGGAVMYKIEKGIKPRGIKLTRWALQAEKMVEGDSLVVANRNEATGLIWALKKRGKTHLSEKVTEDKNSPIRVFCMGEV